jgi:hypothetical protein
LKISREEGNEMATPTVSAITEQQKFEEAQQKLVSQIDRLTHEAEILEGKLRDEQNKLAGLIALRPELARRVAMDEEKPGKARELAISIAEIELRIEGLSTLVAEKRAAITPVTIELRQVQEAEAQRLRVVRFETLKANGTEIVSRLAEKLRALVQDDLPAFDVVRDSFNREFPRHLFNGQPSGDLLSHTAEQLLSEWNSTLCDGPVPRIRQKLLAQGWEPRHEFWVEIRNLRPPKQ